MRIRALGLVLLAVLAALLVPVTSGAATAAESAASITQVTVRADGVAVTGTATAGETVEVRALGAETTADPGSPLANATVEASGDGAFRVELPRRADDGTDLLYAQYVATAGGGAVSEPHFTDDVQAPARRTFPYPREASKKGLQVQLSDDAEELGVQSAAINVSLGELMLTGPDSGRPTIAFSSGGRDFYFDQAVADRLDRQIKPLSDSGAVVDLIILVYRSANPHSAARILMDPAASPTAGTVMGFNTTTREGVAHLTAAMEFLADRYTRDDQRHGRAVGFIMGNEVDAQWEWANSGEKTLDEFLDGYSRALRIGWLATRSAYADARTYVSLTHSWTRPSGANPDEQRPTRFYAGRDVLDRLQELSDTQGAFPWHVAFHPYPQDLFDPTVWDDPDAVDSVDAPVVTFRNLDVLTTYLGRPELAHDGQRRRVILSEQGCNTPGGDVAEAERLQAACYAYAYYRSRFLPGIDSFILHRHVDHRLEGGLALGLWAGDPESSHPAAPLRHKLIYDVFRDIDTRRSLSATEFALDVIGIDSWAEVIPGFDPAQLAERPVTRTVGSRTDSDSHGGRSLDADWETEHNVATLEPVPGGVRFAAPGDVFGSQWRGVGQTFARPVPVAGTHWLTARLQVPDGFPGEEVVARIRATSTSGRVTEADARLAEGGGWRTVAADLRGWAASSRLREVQVWVRGAGTGQSATSVDLGRVALVRNTPASGASNLLASAAMTADADLSATLTLRLRSLDADPLRGSATLVSCGGHAVESRRIDLGGLRLGQTPHRDRPGRPRGRLRRRPGVRRPRRHPDRGAGDRARRRTRRPGGRRRRLVARRPRRHRAAGLGHRQRPGHALPRLRGARGDRHRRRPQRAAHRPPRLRRPPRPVGDGGAGRPGQRLRGSGRRDRLHGPDRGHLHRRDLGERRPRLVHARPLEQGLRRPRRLARSRRGHVGHHRHGRPRQHPVGLGAPLPGRRPGGPGPLRPATRRSKPQIRSTFGPLTCGFTCRATQIARMSSILLRTSADRRTVPLHLVVTTM